METRPHPLPPADKEVGALPHHCGTATPHVRDEDCCPVDGECVVCGVWFADEPCPGCGARAFHDDACPEVNR